MPKRKRGGGPFKPKPTAGPVDESTGQRSVFPEVVPVSARDSEWRYDDLDNNASEIDEREEDEDFVEQVFIDEMLDAREDGVEEEGANDEEEEYNVEEEPEDEDDWDVEPQTEVIAYIEKVRSEASGLPSLTYVPEEPPQVNGITSISPKRDPISDTESDKLWRTQFLQYYTSLREAIATAPEPILSQPELDSLLHINPHYRPKAPDQEDRLWRLKTLDQPSVLLLSMLDHQRTIHLLTHLRKKVSAGVKEEQCMWVVFLLARLGDLGVLSGGEVDLLRRIARKCLGIRNGVEDGAEGSKIVLGTVDMVVCIIKHYYQQKDLEETVQESAD